MMKSIKKKGFTLIELIVVITIIGILSAVIVPNYLGFVNKAKLQADKAEFNEIIKSIELANIMGTIYEDIDGDGDTETINVSLNHNGLYIEVNKEYWEESEVPFVDIMNVVYKTKSGQELYVDAENIGYIELIKTIYYRNQNPKFITYNFETGEFGSSDTKPSLYY